MTRNRTRRDARGFTLLEILLVIAAIAILAGIVIIAVNPARQLGDTRDAQRLSDVDTIANALVQYYIKNGRYPDTLPPDADDTCDGKSPSSVFSICTEGESCDGFSLDTLIDDDYLTGMPQDPLGPGVTSAEYTGYVAFEINNTSRVRVCSPYAENITITTKR